MNAQHDKLEAALARLERRGAALGLEGLAPHEQHALIAYCAHGLISKSGFRLFYAGTFSLSSLVAALRALKLNALANAALSTASQFPDPALADDPLNRAEHLATLDTQKQDYVFFRLSTEELLNAIEAFWKRAGSAPKQPNP